MGETPSFLLKNRNLEIKSNYSLFIIMSREEFRNFVKSVEHNIFIKEKLMECKTSKEIIFLAHKYGYSISLKDFIQDKDSTKFEYWVKESRITPLKYLIN